MKELTKPKKEIKGLPKLKLDQLMIEVTRRCNMTCEHCLRGNQEKVDFDFDTLDDFFPYVDSINTIQFTGGEPSLVPHIIKGILEKAKEHNLYIGSFYLKTNGKMVTDEFLRVIFDLFLYCGDIEDEIPCLEVSQDDGYHDEIKQENIRKLEAFRFTNVDYRDYTKIPILDGGNASWNGIGNKTINCNTDFYVEMWDEETLYIEDMFYINAKGFVTNNCDMSYENQKDFSVGHIKETEMLINTIMDENLEVY